FPVDRQFVGVLEAVELSFHRNPQHLEVCPAQQRPRADKGPSGILLAKIAPVRGVELVIQGHVRAEHLHGYQVVHGHPRLLKSGRFPWCWGDSRLALTRAAPPTSRRRLAPRQGSSLFSWE